MRITVTRRGDGFARWASERPARAQAACTRTAQVIQADYEATARRDTGSMATSVYVTTADGQSDYGPRTAGADALNPRVQVLPELPPPPAPGARVGVAARHAVYSEYGAPTITADPAFTRAVALGRRQLPAELQRAFRATRVPEAR